MSRQIKFRVWNKIRRTYNSVDKLDLQEPEYLRLDGRLFADDPKTIRDISTVNDQDYIVQQFTGLTDKNGKEIYEGDIISGTCLNNGPSICVVGFDTFGIFYTKIKSYPCEPYTNTAMLAQEHNEVIGNAFENPELLK